MKYYDAQGSYRERISVAAFYVGNKKKCQNRIDNSRVNCYDFVKTKMT